MIYLSNLKEILHTSTILCIFHQRLCSTWLLKTWQLDRTGAQALRIFPIYFLFIFHFHFVFLFFYLRGFFFVCVFSFLFVFFLRFPFCWHGFFFVCSVSLVGHRMFQHTFNMFSTSFNTFNEVERPIQTALIFGAAINCCKNVKANLENVKKKWFNLIAVLTQIPNLSELELNMNWNPNPSMSLSLSQYCKVLIKVKKLL